MKDLNINSEERTEFFQKIGPSIAKQISKALQILTAKEIKVEFTGVQTFDQSSLVVDVGERCFGSYVNFKSPEDDLEGIAVAIFPLSSTKNLVELILKRYLTNPVKETVDHEMKLSAFKEAVNVLLLTYITGVANVLQVKVETDVPKFVSLHNLKFVKSALLRRDSRLDSLISIGKFGPTPSLTASSAISKNLALFSSEPPNSSVLLFNTGDKNCENNHPCAACT